MKSELSVLVNAMLTPASWRRPREYKPEFANAGRNAMFDLAEDNRMRIFEAITEGPKRNFELVVITGLSRASVWLHTKNLKAAGLIKRETDIQSSPWILCQPNTRTVTQK